MLCSIWKKHIHRLYMIPKMNIPNTHFEELKKILIGKWKGITVYETGFQYINLSKNQKNSVNSKALPLRSITTERMSHEDPPHFTKV